MMPDSAEPHAASAGPGGTDAFSLVLGPPSYGFFSIDSPFKTAADILNVNEIF